jgi:hypothetical protein
MMRGMNADPEPAAAELVPVSLVPVEVFGADEEDCNECGTTVKCGYGLMDAVQAWSDCNRAIGRIYRVDDGYAQPYRDAGDTVTVYVKRSDLPWFEKRFGEGGGRCPACHGLYAELPAGHRMNRLRPECESPLPHLPVWNLLPRNGRKPPWKCTWHGWVDEPSCAECHRESAEYRETGRWKDRRRGRPVITGP